MRKILLPLVILALVMAATSVAKRISGKQQAAGSQRAGVGHKDQLYVEVSALSNLDYFYDHKLGMRLAGEAFGVTTQYVGPAEYDMPAMITAFEQAMAKKGIKGIVVVGFEPALDPIINKAVDSGIPVVTVDADLPDSKRVAFVGTGNYKAGYEGGTKLAELIGGKGKVAIMTKVGQSNLDERVKGYEDALAKYKGITIAQTVDTQSDAVIAAQVATAALRKNPDLAGIGCVEAAGGVGAATAVKEAGLVGKVKIVSMDRGNEVLQLIGSGVISATVAQRTALMPYYAVQILYDLNNQEIPITTDNAKARALAVPSYVDTGVILVDKSNYKYFIRK
ncbi:MAG: substrate-binding domain-containing protein [Armatimonadota bacterium]|nr:substrate-binding domain-containing protein [Armatimonadota bacterium]